MNSALQVILRHPYEILDNELIKLSKLGDNSKDFLIFVNYVELIELCYISNSNSNTQEKIKNAISNLKHQISKEINQYSYFNQEDSMEFYRNFINFIIRDYSSIVKQNYALNESYLYANYNIPRNSENYFKNVKFILIYLRLINIIPYWRIIIKILNSFI